MLDQFHLFICEAELSPLFFQNPFHHPPLLFFMPSSPPLSGPGQRNTFRRSRGQAAVDEEEEVEASRRCGSKGRPLGQVYDQSQVHRCLHPQYVREWSRGHHGHWPGKAEVLWVNILHKRQVGNPYRVNITSTTVGVPIMDHLWLPIGNIQKFSEFSHSNCVIALGETVHQYQRLASSISPVNRGSMWCVREQQLFAFPLGGRRRRWASVERNKEKEESRKNTSLEFLVRLTSI